MRKHKTSRLLEKRYIKICRYLFFIFLALLCSCFRESRHEKKKNADIIAEAAILAEHYASSYLQNPVRKITSAGNIMLSDGDRGFLIEKNSVKTGLIDSDKKTDAIITIIHLNGNYATGSEHLITLSIKEKLALIKSVESDMRIVNIEKGIITAKVPVHPRSSPLFNCESCQEIVTYRFINGDLVKTE